MSTPEFNVREYLNNHSGSYIGINDGIIKFNYKVDIKYLRYSYSSSSTLTFENYNYNSNLRNVSVEAKHIIIIVKYDNNNFYINIHSSNTNSEGVFVSVPEDSYFRIVNIEDINNFVTINLLDNNIKDVVSLVPFNIDGNSRTSSVQLSRNIYKISDLNML